MSIDVEDWFHSENTKGAVERGSWDLLESRVERNTMRMLEILAEHQVRATFFVLGWVAERRPLLVRAIARGGHEVASHGYGHELVYTLAPAAFRADVVRSKKLLEDLTGGPVTGYRAPCFSITGWAIPILAEAGFSYDSSMVPALAHDRYGSLGGIDGARPIIRLDEGFHEICVSCLHLFGCGVPWGGGGYFRLAPYGLWLKGVQAILRSGRPYVFYIHPWEIDPGQPSPRAMSLTNRFRQRVGLGRCEARFASIVADLEWTTVAEVLADQLARERRAGAPRQADDVGPDMRADLQTQQAERVFS